MLERPRDHFYGAIAGAGNLTVKWDVSPAAVPFGQSFTLSLSVSNAVNPHELTRPPLLELSEFRTLFSAVEDLPDEPVTAGVVTFRYRMTPRNEGTFDIPELTFRYYKSGARAGSTQTVRALAVRFAVAKPPVPAATPLEAPAKFFELRSDAPFSRSGSPPWWAWVGLFVVGGIVAAGWVLGWRLLFPDAARLAAIRRNRAVRTALDRLRRKGVTAETIALVVRNYLIARYGLTFTAQTPAEVAGGLLDVGVPADRVAEAEELLRECDAARFAGAGRPASADRAATMIERWEGVNPPSA